METLYHSTQFPNNSINRLTSNLKFTQEPKGQNKKADDNTFVKLDNRVWEGEYLTACSEI